MYDNKNNDNDYILRERAIAEEQQRLVRRI